MIIETQKLKEISSTILSAIDSSELSTLTESLELYTEDNELKLNVTNGEYFLSLYLDIITQESFHATVNANLFLKLIAATTVENIELTVSETYLEIKGNGIYKLPLIFDDGHLFTLPQIALDNPTLSMNISGEILNSIYTFNSKQLQIGAIAKPVQRMYYVDEHGCITFTTGACVNSFTLEKPVKLLLNNRLVKLFKLFKNNMTTFTLSYDEVSSVLQTRVRFEMPNLILTAITTADSALINSVPTAAIRGRAEFAYPYKLYLSKDELLGSINRLLLFSAGFGDAKNLKPYATFKLRDNKLYILDIKENNKESLTLSSDSFSSDEYTMMLDLLELKTILDSINQPNITFRFGNHQAVVIDNLNISNILPECRNYE